MPTASTNLSRHGVLAGGNWLIDHVKVLDTWPAQDALANIIDQSDGNGGGPYNMLTNLARMQCGFPLAGVGLIGRDADGEHILRDCDAQGIDRRGFHQSDVAPTSYTDVMTVGDTGRRTFFHRQGANALLGREHFNLPTSAARIFYLGYMCLLKRMDALDSDGRTEASYLLQEARQLGLITVADLVSRQSSDFAKIINPSLPHLDYLLLNEYELSRLAGRDNAAGGVAELMADARVILARGVHRAVIVHLPAFALWIGPGQNVEIQPSVRLPQELIRGTVGAGDAFAAGVIYGLHEGWPPPACLELGACVAAASLRDATSSAAVEPWATCLALGRKLGFNTALDGNRPGVED